MNKIEKLKAAYQIACDDYIKEFCKKEDFVFDDWVDWVGSIAHFHSEYFLNFDDIKHDIDSGAPKGLLLQYYDDVSDHRQTKGDFPSINYRSYVLGARFGVETKKVYQGGKPPF